MATYFITGIDTDIGKTIATAMLARSLRESGKTVITAKLAQTGCQGISEDIQLHRRIMGTGLLSEDRAGLTCPYVFDLPASPHLAASCQGKRIDPQVIIDSINELQQSYDIVLVEGAGGLLVPLNDEVLSVDIAVSQNWPIIIVSSPRLGSINHTLLTLEAAQNRNCNVAGIIYNMHQQSNSAITQDSKKVMLAYLKKHNDNVNLIELPSIVDLDNPPQTDLCLLID